MRPHLAYLRYVLRHKLFVFMAGMKTKAPFWRLVIHDWSKFLPCEWFAYTNYFYGKWPKWSDISSGQKFAGYPYELTQEYWKARFDLAWNHHQKSNKHHWQYWVLTNDSDEPKMKALIMPGKYTREMVADWAGAGRAITGTWEVASWYDKNKDNMVLNDHTRVEIERFLEDWRP